MSTQTNERESTRIPAQTKVRVKVLNRSRLAMYAITINLGGGGMLVNATPSLPVGSQCEVTLFEYGDPAVQKQGTVVRSDAGGTAIRFASALAPDTLEALSTRGGYAWNAVVDAYLSYFQVGRNADNAGCETLLGVTKRTFRTVFYTTFSASLPAAVLPVWFLRAAIQPYPVWAKIAACFLYAGLWFLVLQPTVDLGILFLLRNRRPAGASAFRA